MQSAIQSSWAEVLDEPSVTDTPSVTDRNVPNSESNITNSSESTEIEPLVVDYIYIDEQLVAKDGDVNILVSLVDKSININAATLTYADQSGQTYHTDVKYGADGVFLFTPDTQAYGKYNLLSLSYIDNATNATTEFDFNKLGIEAFYEVTTADAVAEAKIQAEATPDKAPLLPTEDSSDVTATIDGNGVSTTVEVINEEGNLESVDSIEEGIAIAEEVKSDIAAEAELNSLSYDKEIKAEKLGVSSTAQIEKLSNNGNVVIVLDPGHGGSSSAGGDPGAGGYGISEREYTLAMAQACKTELLKYKNVEVYLTRENNETFPWGGSKDILEQRAIFAANKHADLFVSFHLNSDGVYGDGSQAYGAEVYIQEKNGVKSPYDANSRQLAAKILAELSALGFYNRGIKYADYSVLRNTVARGIPSVLIEHGFVDNAADNARIKTLTSKIGIGDAKAIASHLKLVPRTNSYVVKPATVTASDSNGKQTKINLTAKAAGLGYADNLYFAVWSNAGGQDDIVWYSGKKSGDTFTATADITKHKTTGKYQVHVYSGAYGQQYYIGAATFTIAANSAKSLVTSDQGNGKWKITLKGLSAPSGVEKVQFPVWSKADQSDIYWYTATKNSDGSYSVVTNPANHKNNKGTYSVHAYVTSKNKIQNFVAGTTFTVKSTVKTLSLAVKETTTQKKYKMTAGNVSVRGNASAVQFAVWSEAGGQNDLIWYKGTKSGDNWSATADITKHKTAGRYQVHIYATIGGKQTFIGSKTFTIKSNSAKTITKVDQGNGKWKLTLTGISAPSGVEKVQFPVWSKSNQSDIYWYTATKNADGSYSVVTNPAKHKNNRGTYSVHAYITSKNKVNNFVAGTSYQYPTPVIKLSLSESQTQKSYKVTVDNPYVLGSVTDVQFATWSESGGQDDLIWYKGKKSGNNWSTTVDVTKHKTAGKYQIHIYATIAGQQKMIGSKTFNVSANSATGSLKVASSTNGTYKVTLTGVKAPSGVKVVQLPVWQSADQSDIYWYTATGSNGTYTATIDPKNHKNHTGSYSVHAYVTSNNQVRNFVAGKTFTVKSNYSIMGASSVTVNQMVSLYNSKGKPYNTALYTKGGAKDIKTFCTILLDEANKEGVKAEVVFAQSMKETGWLQFGGSVKPEQYNFAGIGALNSPSAPIATFPNVRIGLRAQVQHLKAYASTAPPNSTCVDPRFNLVKRNSAPYVEWLGQNENPAGYGWATGVNYGYDITKLISELKSK
ncbi:MAG: GBS Bsp-like repeat-containing protein [Clostridiales Family XIII bacterium]|nr:GBS Bsp-like repeat-containing protein [Clostridiales Family XIII bacterium]